MDLGSGFEQNDFLRLTIVMTFLALCLHFREQVRFGTWSGIERRILSVEEVPSVFISEGSSSLFLLMDTFSSW